MYNETFRHTEYDHVLLIIPQTGTYINVPIVAVASAFEMPVYEYVSGHEAWLWTSRILFR